MGAHGTHAWVYDRRIKQLARMERDWAARNTALGTADAAKWVNRQEHCLTQPRATISINLPTGPCGRPATEAAERRRTAPVSAEIPSAETWFSLEFVQPK